MPSGRLIGLATVVIVAVVVAAIGLPHSPAGLRGLLLGLGPERTSPFDSEPV